MIRQRMVAGLVAGVAIVGLAACGSDCKSSDTTCQGRNRPPPPSRPRRPPRRRQRRHHHHRRRPAPPPRPRRTCTDDIAKGDSRSATAQGRRRVRRARQPRRPARRRDRQQGLRRDEVEGAERPQGRRRDAEGRVSCPFAQAVKAAGGDMTKARQDPDVQKALQAMSSADVQTASTNMQKWTERLPELKPLNANEPAVTPGSGGGGGLVAVLRARSDRRGRTSPGRARRRPSRGR